MTTATVAGVVKAPDGSAYANRPFVFELAVQHVTSSGGSVYAPERVTGTTSGAGAISVELLRGRVYSLRITTSDGIKYGAVTVPDSAGPFDLAALIDNGIVPVIPATPPVASAVYPFASRAAFVAADLSALPDGAIATAGGLFWERRIGATAIADKPGWLPFGIPSPDHFGTNTTPGTTDMFAAILAAIAYADTQGGVFNGVTVGAIVDGRGASYAVSSTVGISAAVGVILRNCTIRPIAPWSAAAPLLDVNRSGGGGSRRYFRLEDSYLEGNHVANGIRFNDAGECAVVRCGSHGTPNYAVQTVTRATELRIEGCDFRQWHFGEVGFDVEANRTATLIDIATADYYVYDNTLAYAFECLRTSTSGPGQVHGNHMYNGFLASATFQTRLATIAGPNTQVDANYFDNGIVRIDASVLDGGPGISLTGNLFHRNSNATNTNLLEIFGGVNSALPGLVIQGNTFESGPIAMLFTGTYANVEDRLWTVSGNTTKPGNRITGMPDICARNVFQTDSVTGSYMRSPFLEFIQGSEDAVQLRSRRGMVIQVDSDNNSGAAQRRGTLLAGNDERIRWDGFGIGFFGSAAAAQQTVTGSRGGNAALASLLTALAAHGLIVNNTTT